MTKRSNRLLGIISDPHCGSTLGLLPTPWFTAEGNEVRPNEFQKWLLKCWTETQDWLRGMTAGDGWTLVLNGDLEEGVHHGGSQIVSNQSYDHTNAATQLFKTFTPKPSKIYVVKGTECHTRDNEEKIAKDLGAEADPDTGKHCFDILNAEVCGVQISVRHHFPATSRAYLEASQHSIQMGNAIIEAHRNSDPIPRILIGAHRHRMGHFSDGKSLTVVTPAWQGLTRHGFKVVPDGRANPGMYLLDWRNREDGELPEVHSIRFETKRATRVVI
jgi:hypothetical protein